MWEKVAYNNLQDSVDTCKEVVGESRGTMSKNKQTLCWAEDVWQIKEKITVQEMAKNLWEGGLSRV